MKTLLRFTLLAAGLASAAFAAPNAPASAPAIPVRRLQALQRAKTAIVDRRLGLNDDQKAKVTALRTQMAATAKAIRENPALTPEQKRDQIAAAGKATHQSVKSLLAPDQLAKLAQITSHSRELNALAVRRVRAAAVAKQLGVTPEQRTALRAIRDTTAAAVKALRADASLAAAQRQAKVRELFQGARTEMRTVLTAEQREKLQQIRARLLAPLGPLAIS